MKNGRTMKMFSVILILALTLSLGMTAYASEEKSEIVKTEIVGGAVITEYSDGTKCAVDTDGTIYTKEKDGSVTQQNPDGSMVSEDAKGNSTIYRADGSIEGKVLADGTVEEWKKCGDNSLIKTTYPESSEKPSEISFENGEGKLTWTKDGYQGATTAQDGTEFKISTDKNEDSVMTITQGDTVITGSSSSFITDDGKGGYKEAGHEMRLTSNNGFKYETKADYGTGEYSIAIDDGEGSKIDIEGSSGKEESEMSFSDGSYYTNKDGQSEYYDAQSGNYGKTYTDDKGNVISECDITNNGVRLVIKDGNVEIHNTETGEYMIRNADGSMESGNTKTSQRIMRDTDGKTTLTGDDKKEDTAEKPADKPFSGGISIDELVGNHPVVMSNDDGDTHDGLMSLIKNENGQLAFSEKPDLPFDYDPATGTAIYDFSDNGIRCTYTVVFTTENGAIHCTGTMVLASESGAATLYIEGTKTD